MGGSLQDWSAFEEVVVGFSYRGRGRGVRETKKGGDRETFKKGIGRIGRLGKIGLGGGIRSIQSWGSVAGVDILVRGGQG